MEYKFYCTENINVYCVCPIHERDRKIDTLRKEKERLREAVNKLIPRVHELRNNTLRSGNPCVLDLSEDIEFAKKALDNK